MAKGEEMGSSRRDSKSRKRVRVSAARSPPHWLPDGWVMEVRNTQKGAKYKSYFDPFTGSRFFSKADVLRFLTSGEFCPPTAKQKRNFSASTKENVLAHVEYSPDGLPPGWIKEVVIRKAKNRTNGLRKDPYYIDPVSGYVFRTFKDAVRYVETGELSKYAFGPRKKSTADVYYLENQSPELKKSGTTAMQCLFTEEIHNSAEEMAIENGESSGILQLPPPDHALSKSVEKVEPVSPFSDVKHIEGKIKKKRKVSESATESLLETSNHLALKTERGTPAKCSKVKENEERKDVVESEKIAGEPSEPGKEIQQAASERNQVIEKPRCWKTKPLGQPRRASKRLAGLEPPPVPELVIRRPSRKSMPNNRDHEKNHPLVLEELERSADCVGEQATLGEQVVATKESMDDKSQSQLTIPFDISWPDPCIEFAVKTLIGEIPVLDEGIAIEEYVQLQLSSADTLKPSASSALDPGNHEVLDRSKLPAKLESPAKENWPVHDEGKPCPVETRLPLNVKMCNGSRRSQRLNP